MMSGLKFRWVKWVSSIVIISFPVFNLQAQETALAAGGSASGSGGTAEYSLGVPLYTNQTQGSLVITQGPQQPAEILTNGYIKAQSLKVNLFPNPAVDWIEIRISGISTPVTLKISDLNGREVIASNLLQSQTQVSLQNLSAGMYMACLLKENETIFSTKIVKN